MHPFDEAIVTETRRQFFGSAARGLGLAALASLLDNGQLLGDVLQHPKNHSRLLLGEEIHLQIKLRPFVRLLRQAVLADENEEREEDGLKRYACRQKIEREWIKWLDTGYGMKIDQKPQDEPNQMEHNRLCGACNPRNRRRKMIDA